jgi:hypothetical protein
MSLINEALKKAQRQRSDIPSGAMPSAGGFDQRGPRPMRTQSIVLLVAGAAVLVVFSVVITVYLVNRNPGSAATPPLAATPTPLPPAVDLDAPPPVIVAPAIAIAPPVVEAESAAVAGTAAPAAAPAVEPIAIPPIAPAARQPELHIQLFVDAIRVMGVRSSGGESKVLMNDRVYRVNDIVDRALVLKLVKVEPELLTFTDPNGMVYTKSF